MGRYFKRDSSPVEVWSDIPEKDFENPVAETEVNSVKIVTVFTGINLGTEEEPKIFETTIEGGMYDKTIETYYHESEALAGHAKWVDLASQHVDSQIVILGEAIKSMNGLNPYMVAKRLIEDNIVKVNNV